MRTYQLLLSNPQEYKNDFAEILAEAMCHLFPLSLYPVRIIKEDATIEVDLFLHDPSYLELRLKAVLIEDGDVVAEQAVGKEIMRRALVRIFSETDPPFKQVH